MSRFGKVAVAAAVIALAIGACTSDAPHPHSPRGSSAQEASAAVRSPGPWRAPTQPWVIPATKNHGIEGFADASSVLAGQQVRLFVSTPSARFRLAVFRMGWYGGALGRLIWSSSFYSGIRQSRPSIIDATTHTVAARWSRPITVATLGWAPGDYLLRLEASGGGERYVPLTVRGPSARGRVVIINAVTTWQAYNQWGCCSLYNGANGMWSSRARAVSFDRPYQNGSGAGEFLERELPLVAEAERLALPLDYVTDTDLQSVPGLLDGARAVISLGHDEYWSPTMRAALTRARDAGANLAFLGANAIYRRIRLAPDAFGPARLEINYKDASEDPLLGHDDPAVTANWPAPPDADPESSLVGAQYGCRLHGPNVSGVIVDPSNWLLAGLAQPGEALPGLVGYEIDAVQLADPTPQPIEVLLHSPTPTCPNHTPGHADTTYYEAASGAGVFDAGTIDWTCAIRDACDSPLPQRTVATVRAITDRLLAAFAKGPARQRAQSNLAALHIKSRPHLNS